MDTYQSPCNPYGITKDSQQDKYQNLAVKTTAAAAWALTQLDEGSMRSLGKDKAPRLQKGKGRDTFLVKCLKRGFRM